MNARFRLPVGGSVIDRARPLHFTFDGKGYQGLAGDTVASALIASGVHLMGRSFKYHRPRGVLGLGIEEPNALLGIDRGGGRFEPNQRATMVPLADGMMIESQNRSPSLSRDFGAINDIASPLIPAGFYYKTFMWPRSFWAAVYEPVIRRTAGLGRAPTNADPDSYGQRWAHADTLVVGGGPAGLAAALAAAASGGRVILCDEGEEWGGALRDEPGARIDDFAATAWVKQAISQLAAIGRVRMLLRTTAFAYGIDNFVALAERCDDSGCTTRERQWFVRAAQVVIATGSIERPLVFPNNDRPGIMLASAARGLLHRHAVLAGQRVVVAVHHDSGYRAARDLAAAGAQVTIADARAEPEGALVDDARSAGIDVLVGHIPLNSRGRLRVSALAVGRLTTSRPRWLGCDLVLMAGGWTPSLHLYSQSGGKVVWDEAVAAFVPGKIAQVQASAGACRGSFALGDCLAQGWAAGGGAETDAPRAEDRSDKGIGPEQPPAYREGARAKAFVDFQNDVTAKDIRLAVREGFRSVEHIKRYTTNGMATDQGKTSNINALAIAAQAMSQTIPETGLTTFRAPFSPTTFGTLTGFTRGELFEPKRHTPMHGPAVAACAVFEDVGQWQRARYFPRVSENMDEAVGRECRAVRSTAGIFDASTLGKIEVVGPDAGTFLDRMYTGTISKIAIGRCRYAVMLREDGFIADDGVIARLAVDRFHVTTTSGGAAQVLATMEDFRQTEWPELRVWLTSTTEQWAVIAVTGPKARAIIDPMIAGIDLSREALPHMAVREGGTIAGVPLRLFRVSFTGELGFEINVPSDHGLAAWNAVVAAGAEHGAELYGTEAAHVLRAEKGYIIVGQETDGTVTPDDVGLGRMVAMKKPDFVGKRSLLRPAIRDPDRAQLVALLTPDRSLLEEGAQVIDPVAPRRSLGHVTSAYRSDALGRPFALAMVASGRARIGSQLHIAGERSTVAVELCDPVLFDREGARVNG